jgi:hypothetical protein
MQTQALVTNNESLIFTQDTVFSQESLNNKKYDIDKIIQKQSIKLLDIKELNKADLFEIAMEHWHKCTNDAKGFLLESRFKSVRSAAIQSASDFY